MIKLPFVPKSIEEYSGRVEGYHHLGTCVNMGTSHVSTSMSVSKHMSTSMSMSASMSSIHVCQYSLGWVHDATIHDGQCRTDFLVELYRVIHRVGLCLT